MTATITKHSVHFDLPEVVITFDRARRCLVVEGQGDRSEASTGTSYPFSLIDTIHVEPLSECVSKLTVVFQGANRLVLCRVERELATRLAWVLGEMTRASVELETLDGAPLGPTALRNEEPFCEIGPSVVTRLLDRRGPDTQETPRSELIDDDMIIPEVDPADVIELISGPSAEPRPSTLRSPPPRAGSSRSRHPLAPARPRRSSVRDTAPDMRSPLLRADSDSNGSWR